MDCSQKTVILFIFNLEIKNIISLFIEALRWSCSTYQLTKKKKKNQLTKA